MFVGSHDNFGKRYENKINLIFENWPKLYIGLNANLKFKSCIDSSLYVT